MHMKCIYIYLWTQKYNKLYNTYKMHIFFWKFLFTQWFTFLFKSFNNILRYYLILSVFIIQRNLDSEKLFYFDIITQISGRVILYIYTYIYEWVSSWIYCVFLYVVSKNSIWLNSTHAELRKDECTVWLRFQSPLQKNLTLNTMANSYFSHIQPYLNAKLISI